MGGGAVEVRYSNSEVVGGGVKAGVYFEKCQ